jgi:hypothetical protein
MKRRGCPSCGHISTGCSKKSNTQEFINRAELIHNGKYDYSKVEYNSNKIKVSIICKIHGEFLQRPQHHLIGIGCPKCGTTLRILSRFKNKHLKTLKSDCNEKCPEK